MCRPAAACVKFAKTMRFASTSSCYNSLFWTLNISHGTFCTCNVIHGKSQIIHWALYKKLHIAQCTICKDCAVCQHQLLLLLSFEKYTLLFTLAHNSIPVVCSLLPLLKLLAASITPLTLQILPVTATHSVFFYARYCYLQSTIVLAFTPQCTTYLCKENTQTALLSLLIQEDS